MDAVEAGLVQDFIDESAEGLQVAERCLVALETDKNQQGLIQELFRILHSIKGNAALFGFEAMKLVAHDAEHLLDHLRNQPEILESSMIDVLLGSLDFFHNALDELRAGNQWPPEYETVAVLRTQLSGLLHAAREKDDPVTFAVGELKELIEMAHESAPHIANRLYVLSQQLNSMIESAGPIESGPVAQLKLLLQDEIEDVMSDDHIIELEQYLYEMNDGAVDTEAKRIAGEALEGYQVFSQSVGVDEALRQYLLERLTQASDSGQWSWQREPASAEDNAVEEQASAATVQSQKSEKGTNSGSDEATEHHKSMRVSEEHIDTFLAYVGDLLVIGDTFHHLQRRLYPGADVGQLSRDFRRANETFQSLSGKLQQSIMAIRQIPGDILLRRVPRLVRDVAQLSNKKVVVECSGNDLHLDKSLVELLEAPLTHLVRNAIDHGIEEQAERGDKNPTATVQVILEEEDQRILLMVSDDGRGLNFEKIREAAVERGIIKGYQELDHEAVVQLIFASGVSTAQEVSEISGRGVGLDVVHANIVAAGGSVKVDSTAGVGTTFTIAVPKSVTTQIIMGFLVDVEGHTFVIPMDRIRDSMRYRSSELHRISDEVYGMKCHGKVLPVLPMGLMLGDSSVHEILSRDSAKRVAVRCQIGNNNGQECLVVVDQVLGVQQVVLRPIDGMDPKNGVISGGALLGDGSVSLIVDVAAVYEAAAEQRLAAVYEAAAEQRLAAVYQGEAMEEG